MVEYDEIMDSLKPVERLILKLHIDKLDEIVKAGFYPLNWHSQRIESYISELEQGLVAFSSIVVQVHKNAKIIQQIIDRIASTYLLADTDLLNDDGVFQPMELNQFFDVLEIKRRDRLDTLELDYRSVGETYLIKLEEIIFRTATGCHPHMGIYYHYWERLFYNAITEMVIRSMATLMALLQCKDVGPLIKVTVTMSGKDLVVSPSLTEIDKALTKGVRNLAESARSFIRWMHGTCK